MQSLTAWLAQHSQHLRRLQIPFLPNDQSSGAAVAACLEMVGAAGQLVELSMGRGILSTQWLAALRSLRRLKLKAPWWPTSEFLHISPAIHGLTALEHLELKGSFFQLGAGVRLPASITRVELSFFLNEDYEEVSNACSQVLLRMPVRAASLDAACGWSHP